MLSLIHISLNEAPLTGFRFQFQAHVLGGNKRLRPDQTYPLLKKSLFLRTAIKALAREEVAPRFSYVFLIAVSYTHLDVYKRQRELCIALRIIFKKLRYLP